MRDFRSALPDATDDDLEKLAVLFPDVLCPYEPTGHWVATQEPIIQRRTRSGLLELPDMVLDVDKMRQSVGLVIGIGPMAGWDDIAQDHVKGWPHFPPGSFVKMSQHSSTRWDFEEGGAEWRKRIDASPVSFRLIPWRDIMAVITSVREILR